MLLPKLGVTTTVANDDIDLFLWWTWARHRVPRGSRKGFDSLVMLTCWVLWKERNAQTFWNEAMDTHKLCLEIL